MEALKPEFIAPLVLYLSHESCTETHAVFEVAAGWIAKVRWQRSEGVLLRDKNFNITPESGPALGFQTAFASYVAQCATTGPRFATTARTQPTPARSRVRMEYMQFNCFIIRMSHIRGWRQHNGHSGEVSTGSRPSSQENCWKS